MSNKSNNARTHLRAELNKMAQCLFPTDCPIPFSKVCMCSGLVMAVYAIMLMLKASYENVVAIYAIVAGEFQCTIDAVVSSIRYMIAMLWDKNQAAFCAYAGTNLDKQPTVPEFLALLLAKMRAYQKQHPEVFEETAETAEPTDTAETADTAKPEETAQNTEAAEAVENVDAKQATQEQSQKDNVEATEVNKDEGRKKLQQEIIQKAKNLFPDGSPIPFRKVWNYRGLKMAAYATMLMQKAPDEKAVAIYAIVASEFKCTIDAVANSIRYMITVLWNKDREAFCAYAGTNLDKQPTVTEFLALLLAKLRECQKLHPEAFAEAVAPTETKQNEDTVDTKQATQESERLGN